MDLYASPLNGVLHFIKFVFVLMRAGLTRARHVIYTFTGGIVSIIPVFSQASLM